MPAPKPNFDLIIFDCDGVLVDSEVISCRVHAEVMTRHGYPITAEEVRQRFLGRTAREAAIEIERDESGIPHIYAESDLDAYFGLGYVHAQDCLWQMEMSRRAGSGTLSEVFGSRTLETDRFLRTLGIRRAATRRSPASTGSGWRC